MSHRLIRGGLLALLALLAAGCGGASSHRSATASTASGVTAASTARGGGGSARPAEGRPNTAVRSGGPGSTGAVIRKLPVDGLRAADGYGTYELCSAGCTGSVPSSLQRALHLPQVAAGAACPTTGAGGPVQPSPVGLSLMPFIGSSWEGARVTWTASPSYAGPILIRGAQLDGPHGLGFGEGHVPYDELQVLAPGQQAPTPPGGGRAWLSFTRVRGPGCYAYQVDGTSFSSVIVFRAS